VQSAYKKILIDKILEKDDRVRQINMRREKILQLRQRALVQSNHRNTFISAQQQQISPLANDKGRQSGMDDNQNTKRDDE
jgi:hypothetical protein